MAAEEKAVRPVYIFGIDAVRFLCAMLVTLFHLGFSSWASPLFHSAYRMPAIEYLCQPGWVGVELFFVISGFVIANSAHSASGFSFVRGRLMRLYPAVWVCASITLLVRAHHGVSRGLLHTYANSMLLLPFGSKIDDQYWTLVTEMIFYAVVFVAIISGNMRRIARLADALALLSAAELAVVVLVPNNRDAGAFFALQWNTIFAYGSYFAIGIYLWLWSQARLRAGSMWLPVLSIFVCLMQIHIGQLHGSKRTLAAVGHNFSSLTPILIFLAGLGMIAFSVACKDRVNALPSRLLGILRTLGLMTYPLYLIHFTVGRAALNLFVRLGASPLAALAAAICLVSAIALVVSTWLEPIIRRRLRAWIDSVYGKRASGRMAKNTM